MQYKILDLTKFNVTTNKIAIKIQYYKNGLEFLGKEKRGSVSSLVDKRYFFR